MLLVRVAYLEDTLLEVRIQRTQAWGDLRDFWPSALLDI